MWICKNPLSASGEKKGQPGILGKTSLTHCMCVSLANYQQLTVDCSTCVNGNVMSLSDCMSHVATLNCAAEIIHS